MPRFAFAVPVLPGKEARAIADMMRPRMAEYEDSRRRQGVTMERAYEMATPMGTFVTAYLEAERGFAETMGALAASDLAIDRDFRAGLAEVHGMDVTQPPPGPPPEVVGEWQDSDVRERRPGLAFVAPLLPGRTDAGRAFAQEAWGARRAELAESRRAKGINVEVAVLNSTPQGDMICVYIEGTDPVEGNRQFAASQSGFDTWFKGQLKTIFPPLVDFDQPLPPISTLWDWHRSPVTAS
jgi:hypothetical protein